MQHLPMLFVGFLLVALSGCSDAPDGVEETDAVDAETSMDGGPVPAVGPNATSPGDEAVFEVLPVELDGTLGTWFYACEYQNTGTCQGEELMADDTDLYYERPGASLVGARLTLSWSAATPATDTLGLGIMRMGGEGEFYQNVEGPSPISLDLSDLDVALDDESRLHVYVYNTKGFVDQPPVVGYATVDQAFSIDGDITFRLP